MRMIRPIRITTGCTAPNFIGMCHMSFFPLSPAVAAGVEALTTDRVLILISIIEQSGYKVNIYRPIAP